MDSNSIVALASIALSALTVTVQLIVKIIDHKNQRKNREFDFYQKHRAEAIEAYIHYTGAHIKSRNKYSEYGFNQFEIYMYIDQSLWSYIDEIQALLTSPGNGAPCNFKAAEETLQELCKKLSENPPRNIKS